MEIDLEKVSMTGTARERVIKIIETIPDGKAWPITDVAEKAGTEAEYTRRICSEIGVRLKLPQGGGTLLAACNPKTAARYGN